MLEINPSALAQNADEITTMQLGNRCKHIAKAIVLCKTLYKKILIDVKYCESDVSLAYPFSPTMENDFRSIFKTPTKMNHFRLANQCIFYCRF